MENDRGTVERALRLITYVASVNGDISIKSVSEEMKLPQSTAHRLVQQLVASGFLQRKGSSRTYEFGPAMYRLGAVISSRVDIVQLARPALERVVGHTNEGCALGLFREQDCTVSFAAHIESPLPLRYRIALHEPVSILWGASGRCILAFQPPEVIDKLAHSVPSKSPTGKAPMSRRELLKDLEAIRACGYAVNQRGEKIAGASGISVPIFGIGDKVLGCLSMTIPESRYPAGKESTFARLLIDAASEIRVLFTGTSPR